MNSATSVEPSTSVYVAPACLYPKDPPLLPCQYFIFSPKEVVRPFIQTCLETSAVLMDIFNERLHLPTGTLSELHRPEKECISESRCIRVPPAPKDTKVALGAHTDYGSISFLVNRLGGLQVLVPNSNTSEWKYVKPIDGYAICNIGDTLSILSGGILKSCVHRVVTWTVPHQVCNLCMSGGH